MTDRPRRSDVPSYAELQSRTDGPAGSSWGVFGDHDELGTINFLTPERVLAGARCVRRGAMFNLDFPVDAFPGPVRSRPVARHVMHYLGPLDDGTFGRLPEAARSTMLDDYLDTFYLQASAQIDGLRHVAHPVHGFYGGVSHDEVVVGTPTLGVNRWAEHGIAGRGVLADVARYREANGVPLDHRAGEWIEPDLLEATLTAQGVGLAPGDLLVIRTDYPRYYAAHIDDDDVTSCSAGIARSYEMAGWLWDHQIALVAADNIAVEPTGTTRPSELGEGVALLHGQLIPLLGYALGELWNLDALARDCADDGVYEFQLIAKPLNIVGGVGTPANATAIK